MAILNLLRLSLIFLLAAISYPILRERSAYFFLKVAGAPFVKLGQTLATRPDLVGDNLAAILARFQDQLKPFSYKKAEKILREEGLEFKNFCQTPVASASIAQVHEAYLDNGQKVAVKILRPNIAKIMARDIKTLLLVIKISKFIAPGFTNILKDVAEVLKTTAKIELNLLNEATMAIRLKNNMAKDEGYYVPKIYLDFSTQKVLVSEFLDGIAFSDKKAILNSGHDLKKVAKNLVLSHFNQIYRDGFFHGDSHPGNLFLLKNGDIGVVDFGIMAEIERDLRLIVAKILISYIKKDYQQVAKLHIEGGLVPKEINLIELTRHCQKIGDSIIGNSVKDINFATILANLIEMSKKYQMATRPELLLMQKNIILVEGIGVMLDEELNVWKIAEPWAKNWAKKNLGFDAVIRDFVVDLMDLVKKYRP